MDGPISQRLATLSLIGVSFGRFAEAADSIHGLVNVMAKARVEKQSLAWGRGEAEEKAQLSVETGYIRRQLSIAAVTAFGQRLASRINQVGGQATHLASQRRLSWVRQEEHARLDREAAWFTAVTGKNIVRRGHFWSA